MRVLIIDDSAEALALAKARLKGEGLGIECRTSGRKGLRAVRTRRPDLILLDVHMPEMSGFEVLEALREDDDLRATPVIFLSGSDDTEDIVRGLDLGAVDYVTKPFNAFELRARVRAALRTKRLRDMLAREANIDALTGLANRRAFEQRLQAEWSRRERQAGELGLVLADIDHFKALNDTYGHRTGDVVLEGIGETFRSGVRPYDLACRYGGEEFAVICPGQHAAGAGELAERLRGRVADQPVRTDKGQLAVALSFGVADSRNRPSPQALVEAADRALYEAKANGRDCTCFAPAPDADALGAPCIGGAPRPSPRG